jgi:hypothetical protein
MHERQLLLYIVPAPAKDNSNSVLLLFDVLQKMPTVQIRGSVFPALAVGLFDHVPRLLSDVTHKITHKPVCYEHDDNICLGAVTSAECTRDKGLVVTCALDKLDKLPQQHGYIRSGVLSGEFADFSIGMDFVNVMKPGDTRRLRRKRIDAEYGSNGEAWNSIQECLEGSDDKTSVRIRHVAVVERGSVPYTDFRVVKVDASGRAHVPARENEVCIPGRTTISVNLSGRFALSSMATPSADASVQPAAPPAEPAVAGDNAAGNPPAPADHDVHAERMAEILKSNPAFAALEAVVANNATDPKTVAHAREVLSDEILRAHEIMQKAAALKDVAAVHAENERLQKEMMAAYRSQLNQVISTVTDEELKSEMKELFDITPDKKQAIQRLSSMAAKFSKSQASAAATSLPGPPPAVSQQPQRQAVSANASGRAAAPAAPAASSDADVYMELARRHKRQLDGGSDEDSKRTTIESSTTTVMVNATGRVERKDLRDFLQMQQTVMSMFPQDYDAEALKRALELTRNGSLVASNSTSFARKVDEFGNILRN